jgi:hypothetical protein
MENRNKYENLFIKAEILKYFLIEYEDSLSLQIKKVLIKNNDSKNFTFLDEMQNDLQLIVENCNINLQNYYSTETYWYLMDICYGENATEIEEEMEYIDRFNIILQPGKDKCSETAFILKDQIDHVFSALNLQWKFNLNETKTETINIEIQYDLPLYLTLEDAQNLNEKIRLEVFHFDYTFK